MINRRLLQQDVIGIVGWLVCLAGDVQSGYDVASRNGKQYPSGDYPTNGVRLQQ